MAPTSFSLAEEFPQLAREVADRLTTRGQSELAASVPGLQIVERCRCGDHFCATMYAVPPPRGAWGPGLRTLDLDADQGFLIVDILDDRIVSIEVLDGDDVHDRLLLLLS
jgi:hypothetical protein